MEGRAFDSLVPDARAFFDALAANNSRYWFRENKPDYEARLKRPAEALLDTLADRIAARTGARPATKLFRPNRDLRFSADKTPYHLHLHMLWEDTAGPGAWLFGISRDYVRAGFGAMGFRPDRLARWRAVVAGSEGAALEDILAGLGARGWFLDAPELKRAPAPHGPDHARAPLLRRKSLTAWHEVESAEGLLDQLEARFAEAESLRRWMTAHL